MMRQALAQAPSSDSWGSFQLEQCAAEAYIAAMSCTVSPILENDAANVTMR